MNVDNQTIVHINAGQTLPDDVLQHLLAKCKPNVIGFSIQNLYEGQPDLAVIKEDFNNGGIEDVKRIIVNAKDWPTTMYLGSLNSKYNPDDIQPFVLQDPETKEPFISVFIEGTLNGHDTPADRTEQFNFVNGILMPKINDFCHDFEGDLEKIYRKLSGEIFNKEFLMHVGHRAVLHIMPQSGDLITLGKNELGENYDWGWMSQRHGYGDAKQEPEEKKETVVAKATRFVGGWGKKASAEPPKQEPTTVPPPPAKPDESPEIVAAKSEGAYPAKGKESKAPQLLAKPPEWARKKRDDTRLWYNIVGNLPTGKLENKLPAAWNKNVSQVVLNQEAAAIDNLEDFIAYALKRKMMPGAVDTAPATAAGKPPAATSAADVKSISQDLPILNKDTLDKVLEYVASLDTSSKDIVPPKEIQTMESALPKFSEQVGLVDKLEMINWKTEWLLNIAKRDPMALVCYAIEWRAAYRALATGQPMAGEKPGKTVVETEKTITTTEITPSGAKLTSSISKEAPPAPKKAAGGWGRKAA